MIERDIPIEIMFEDEIIEGIINKKTNNRIDFLLDEYSSNKNFKNIQNRIILELKKNVKKI